MHFGIMELSIILLIVVLLFGAGRISRLGHELGTGIRGFRKGLEDDEPNNNTSK